MSCNELSRSDPEQAMPSCGRHDLAQPRRAWGRLLATLLVMVAVGSHAPAHGQGYSEIEPNNPCGNAQDLLSAVFPLRVTGYKTQPFGDAVDFYQFSAAPGTQLHAELSGDPSHPNPLTAFGVGVFNSDCPEYPNFSAFTINSTARVSFTVPADGTFIIGVTACCDTNFSGSGTIEGAYVLAVGPPPAPTVVTGVVTDAETGVGLPGNQPPFASVTLEQCFDYGYWGYCYSLQSGSTDSQGHFRIEGEFDGNFRVRVNADPNWYEQPVLRPTGPSGARARTGPVWILWPSSTAPGTYEHHCTLPRGVHLLVGIADAFWIQTPLDDPSFTEEDWRELAQFYFGYFFPVIDIRLELDGRPVVFDPRTPIVRTQTPVFTAAWNADNMFGLDPVAYLNGFPIVDEGYWSILMPLSPGEHVLKISPNSTLERTYHLTVR